MRTTFLILSCFAVLIVALGCNPEKQAKTTEPNATQSLATQPQEVKLAVSGMT